MRVRFIRLKVGSKSVCLYAIQSIDADSAGCLTKNRATIQQRETKRNESERGPVISWGTTITSDFQRATRGVFIILSIKMTSEGAYLLAKSSGGTSEGGFAGACDYPM